MTCPEIASLHKCKLKLTSIIYEELAYLYDLNCDESVHACLHHNKVVLCDQYFICPMHMQCPLRGMYVLLDLEPLTEKAFWRSTPGAMAGQQYARDNGMTRMPQWPVDSLAFTMVGSIQYQGICAHIHV